MREALTPCVDDQVADTSRVSRDDHEALIETLRVENW
jgi:hypothetical protein